MTTIFISIHLAIRDWFHEFRLSICSVLALTSMLTPILILHGVYTGVVNGLKERLLTDPSVLIIIPSGLSGAGYTEDFFNEIKKNKDADFIIGRTRDVAAELQLNNNEKFLTVTLEPTADGDPLLKRSNAIAPKKNPKQFNILLSFSAAKKLNVSVGDHLNSRISRRLSTGKSESVKIDIVVLGILPIEATNMDSAFLDLNSLIDIQDYRDGIEVSERSWSGQKAEEIRHFESFRLYAKSLEGVENLDKWFQSKNISVKTKAKEIASIRNIDQSLSLVVLIISSAVCAGFLAFMFSSVQATIKRKEKMLGLLRLSGFTQSDILIYPIAQSLLTGFIGYCIAFILYITVAEIIDVLFASQTAGSTICTIPLINIFIIFISIIFLSFLACLQPAYRASKIEPAKVIRNF